MNNYEKKRIYFRGWLAGRGYHRALQAYEFAAEYHQGLRKDDITPEYQHQTEIAMHVALLPDLIFPEDTIITAILHDTVEDTNVSRHDVASKFGEVVADATWRVTKVEANGDKRDEDQLYIDMAANAISSIVKPADRKNNQGTMGEVYTPEKMMAQVEFTETRILPMIKVARKAFPQQMAAYQLLQNELTTQNRMVRAILNNSR